MSELEWVDKYFPKDDIAKCVGTYIALLVLRFERRNNYEKIINIDELLQSIKLNLTLLLGSSAAYRAYISGREFIEELFNKIPEALQASVRFRILEYIESRHYATIRKNYLYLVENEISKISPTSRYVLYRILNDLKYGKIPVIDRTCAGSCYVSRLDISSRYVKGTVESLNELIDDFAKVGIIKPNYLRMIIPAPLLEDYYIRKLLGSKTMKDLISTIDSILKTFGYYQVDIGNIDLGNREVLKIVYEKKLQDNTKVRFEVYYSKYPISRSDIDKIFQESRGSVIRILIYEYDIDEEVKKILREVGIIPIQSSGREIDKYVVERIVNSILDITSLSYIAQLKHTLLEILEL